MPIGRETQVIDCRETAGLALGGGLAQRGTFSEAEKSDIVILSMGPSPRHITKPVCEITYGLREAGFQVSVLVLKAGIGPPEEFPGGPPTVGAGISGISPEEEKRIARHKLAIIHQGNIPRHFVQKAKIFLRNVKIPAIVICQAPADFKDYAKAGVRTKEVKPEKPETKGMILDIVNGVIRGRTCPQDKIDEIVEKVKYWIKELENNRVWI